MTVNDLRDELIRRDVPSDAFDLDGGHLSERYTLRNDSLGWHVYYSERGLETGIKHFSQEDDACNYFMNLIDRDDDIRSLRGDP